MMKPAHASEELVEFVESQDASSRVPTTESEMKHYLIKDARSNPAWVRTKVNYVDQPREKQFQLTLLDLEDQEGVSNRLLFNEMDFWDPIKFAALRCPKTIESKRSDVKEKYDTAVAEFKQRLYERKRRECRK
jgi:hypothetical protein